MIKVFIADDEPWVLQLIKLSVDWEKYGLEIIGEASDGAEAYKAIIELQPDVVLIDIRMPSMDGLTVITNINMTGFDIKFIVVTGHNDFEYVKTALKSGVVNYLIKPIEEDELLSTLLEIKSKIIKKKKLEDTSTLNNETRIEDSKIELQELYLENLMHSQSISSPDFILETINTNYNFDFIEGDFIVLLYLFDCENDAEINYEPFLNTIDGVLSKNRQPFRYFRYTVDNRIIVIMNFPLMADKQVTDRLDELTTKSFKLAQAYGILLTVGIGTNVPKLIYINVSYMKAKQALRNRLLHGTGNVYYADKTSADKTKLYIISGNEFAIMSYTETCAYKELYELIINLINQATVAYNSADVLFDVLQQMVDTVYIALTQMDLEILNYYRPKSELMNALDDCYSMDILYTFIKRNICEPLRLYAENPSNSCNQVVLQAKEYARKHYAEDIMTTDVAKHVYLNPAYFSTLFKKETGIGFKDYLMNLRMEMAGILLCDLQYSISKVAEMVGINDARYFSKLFKKYSGLRPQDYRRQRRLRNE